VPIAESGRKSGMSRPALVALCLLLALNLLNFIDRYILPGTQPLIQAEFHASDQAMGALTTALFITYMLTAPLTGWLGDRFRRKPLIVTGAVLWSLATLATYFVHDYWTLYFRHALVGVGEATFTIFAPAVLSDFFPPRERNRILSIFYLAIPVRATLGKAVELKPNRYRSSSDSHNRGNPLGVFYLPTARRVNAAGFNAKILMQDNQAP